MFRLPERPKTLASSKNGLLEFWCGHLSTARLGSTLMDRLQGIPVDILVVLAINIVVASIGYFAVTLWDSFGN